MTNVSILMSFIQNKKTSLLKRLILLIFFTNLQMLTSNF